MNDHRTPTPVPFNVLGDAAVGTGTEKTSAGDEPSPNTRNAKSDEVYSRKPLVLVMFSKKSTSSC